MKIIYQNLLLKSVTPEDADFIYDLRIQKGEFLNNTVMTRDSNRGWIEKYPALEKKKEQFYFIIQDIKTGERLGCVRCYNIDYQEKTFTSGSWLIKEGVSPIISAISAFLLYDFGFNFLSMEKLKFEVRKGNDLVNNFHKSYGARLVDKNDIENFYEFNKEEFVSNISNKHRINSKFEE